MSAPDQEPENLDERLDGLFDRMGEFLEKAMSRSANRLVAEVKRLAKAEQRLIPYLRSTFHLMDLARDLLEPEVCRSEAVELIALLESEDHARLIQSDFPQHEYDSTIAWMTTCAYDNLAEATGMAQGYNSEGMHGCISDGIQVCQRTGKLECVNCFREYAAEVYLSADDLPMALHQARLIASPNNTRSQRGDRRWLGAHYESWVLLLTGQLEAAEEAAQKSVSLTDSPQMNLPLFAKLRATPLRDAVLLLAGKDVERPGGVRVVGQPGEGEYPMHDIHEGMTLALESSCRGDHAGAITTLSRWDRWLQERSCTSEWFEVRLRLTAEQLLSGNRKQAEALARQLEARAQKARDWLTLARLRRLLDPDTQPTPVPLLRPLTAGPFTHSTPTESVTVPETLESPPSATAEASPEPETPLAAGLQSLRERVEETSEDADERAELLDLVLSHGTDVVTHPRDASLLVYLASRLADVPGRGSEIWSWAEALASAFPQDAEVLNLLAWVGFRLGFTAEEVNPGQGLEESLSPDNVDKLFRRSLDLDPNQVAHFARAGLFYLNVSNLGEAERCLARGFRLDRSNNFLALRLSEVYRQTDRPRDALMVLDMCLREGGDDPQLAYDAAMTALGLEQWDALTTYLERFEQQRPGEPWTQYYRALGLLELQRPDEALEAIEAETEREPPGMLHLDMLRARAAAALGRIDEFRDILERILDVRLTTVDYLSRTGLVRLYDHLWSAADCLPENDPLREQLEELLLQTGLAPENVFDRVRQRNEKASGLSYYRCIVRQPLDDDWPLSPGCLAGEEEWREYRILWGVLARDEDEASNAVLEWQSRCYSLPAEVADVQLDSDGYTDRPGVVWQGFRDGETEAEEEIESLE